MRAHHTPAVPATLTVALIAVLTAAGCTTARQKPATSADSGKVAYRQVEQAGDRHYQLAPGETASGGTLTQNPAPVYPQALIAKHPPPTTVLAHLVIGKDGDVHAVHIGGYDGTPAYRQAFSHAVRKAAMTWSFTPLVFTRTIQDGHGPTLKSSHAKPYSLWYRFRFDIVDGKPVTSSAAGSN